MPDPLQRYDIVTNFRCGQSVEELERADDGEWVRWEDVEAHLAIADAEIARLRQQQTWDAVCARLALILEPQCVMRDGNRAVHWCDVESAFAAGPSPVTENKP